MLCTVIVAEVQVPVLDQSTRLVGSLEETDSRYGPHNATAVC
jgi:hypothetical protein